MACLIDWSICNVSSSRPLTPAVLGDVGNAESLDDLGDLLALPQQRAGLSELPDDLFRLKALLRHDLSLPRNGWWISTPSRLRVWIGAEIGEEEGRASRGGCFRPWRNRTPGYFTGPPHAWCPQGPASSAHATSRPAAPAAQNHRSPVPFFRGRPRHSLEITPRTGAVSPWSIMGAGNEGVSVRVRLRKGLQSSVRRSAVFM